MKNKVLPKRGTLIKLFLAFGVLSLLQGEMVAQGLQQRAEIPLLSMTGVPGSYRRDLYSDGRIWLGYSDTRERDVLIPVFAQNLWLDSTLINDRRFGGRAIYSFTFVVYYDGRALSADGIQTRGPLRRDTNAVARDFNFEWEDKADTVNYGRYFRGGPSQETRYGRRLTITGTSTKRLPYTDVTSRAFEALLWIKFRIKLTKQQVEFQPQIFSGANKSALYVSNDSLRWGDLRVGYDNPFPRVSDADASNPFKDKTYRRDIRDSIGLSGISISSADFPDYPSRPGMIWVNIGENPVIGFRDIIGNTNNTVRVIENTDNTLWEVVNPIFTDSSVANQRDGTRDIQVQNTTPRSRLTNLTVQSDAEWLLFNSIVNQQFNPIPNQTRFAEIPFLDNGINGPVGVNLPDATNQEVAQQPPMNFRIRCRTALLRREGEFAGIYVGHITFASNSALSTPVRLQVRMIFLRNPLEPYVRPALGREHEFGVKVTVRNSRGAIGDTTNLLFGTGHRASDLIDTLFGEAAYDAPASGFNARWYAPWAVNTSGVEVAPFGFADQPLEFEGNVVQRMASRDIRNFSSDTTLLFLCRFNAAGAQNYPIVINWDVQDFPEGSQLFLRDTLNGSIFSVDMRNATPDPNYSARGFSFTIRDARINSFIIEYRLPGQFRYLSSVLKNGWNFLSLPLRPSDVRYQSVFPNAINKPLLFSQNQYQGEDVLRPGYGYFVKYGQVLDTNRDITGVRLSEIRQPVYPVRMFAGWNTVGALSNPVSVNCLRLEFAGIGTPQRQGAVYRYNTNRGYEEVSELAPGLGHWVKITADAFLNLQPANCKVSAEVDAERNAVLASSARVEVTDAEGKGNTLYLSNNKAADLSYFELPPFPMQEMFDVRFTGSNAVVETSETPVIRLQGATFPVQVSVDRNIGTRIVVDAVTGRQLGVLAAGQNTVTISDANTTLIKVLKADAISGVDMIVSPNPVNGEGRFVVTAANNELVSIVVFDAVGNEISRMSGVVTGGAAEFFFNVDQLPAGMYTARLISNGSQIAAPFTVVK